MSAGLPGRKVNPLDRKAFEHSQDLLDALGCAKPVLFEGKERFIQVMHARLAGGRVEVDIWLTGGADQVDPAALTIAGAPK